jgi:hypothetical protein
MATLQERYFNVLTERVRTEKYPSHQMLDWIEASIATSDQMVEYIEMLMQNVSECRYPSYQMLERIRRMMLVIARA